MTLTIVLSPAVARDATGKFYTFMQQYAKTFELRTETGARGSQFKSDTEVANISFTASKSTTPEGKTVPSVIIQVAYDEKPGNSFRGKVMTFIAAYFHMLCRIDPSISMNTESSKVPGPEIFNKWGEWGYTEVKKIFPKI